MDISVVEVSMCCFAGVHKRMKYPFYYSILYQDQCARMPLEPGQVQSDHVIQLQHATCAPFQRCPEEGEDRNMDARAPQLVKKEIICGVHGYFVRLFSLARSEMLV